MTYRTTVKGELTEEEARRYLRRHHGVGMHNVDGRYIVAILGTLIFAWIVVIISIYLNT
jgi:hypothetical protein